MGSPDTERQRGVDEIRHEVRISPFYVDPFEVRQSDYFALIGANPSAHRGKDSERLPVENVTWFDAVRYCNALSRQRGLEPAYILSGEAVSWNRKANGYRLLTEAEWEYAARAGTTTAFNTGKQVHSDAVNFEATYPYLIEENYVSRRDPSVKPSRYRGHTIAVDALPANAFGLHHTHGNVSEWVFDFYGAYETNKPSDPSGPSTGALRVNRGGSYIDFGKHLRSAYRSATNPIDSDPNLGFRLCRNATEHPENIVDTEAPRRIAMPAHPRVLVAYFSYSGNTKHAAEIIAELLHADLHRIVMLKPYAGNIYDVSQRDLNSGNHPPLRGDATNWAQYDVVLLGYPTWWATMPMPVYSFLDRHDCTGKIILPFSSHGGTVWGDSVSDLAKAVPGAYVGEGFEFHYSGGGSLKKDLAAWLKRSCLLP